MKKIIFVSLILLLIFGTNIYTLAADETMNKNNIKENFKNSKVVVNKKAEIHQNIVVSDEAVKIASNQNYVSPSSSDKTPDYKKSIIYTVDMNQLAEDNSITPQDNLDDVEILYTIQYYNNDTEEEALVELYEIINDENISYPDSALDIAITAVESEPKINIYDAGYSYSKPSTACQYKFQHSSGLKVNKRQTYGNFSNILFSGSFSYAWKIKNITLGASTGSLVIGMIAYQERHSYINTHYYGAVNNKYCNTKGMEIDYFYNSQKKYTTKRTIYIYK